MKGKTILGIGAAIAAVWMLTKKASAGGGGGDNLQLVIIPAGSRIAHSIGYDVGAIAPATLVEGSVGNTAQVTVTNTTVYTGTTTKAPYTFTLNIVIGAGLLLLDVHVPLAMLANETQTKAYNFNVPYGATLLYAGTAWLGNTANSAQIGSQATVNGSITPAGVTPGGTVTF